MRRTYFKSCWTPVHKLDISFGFYWGDGGVDVFRHNIAPIEQTTCHILSMARITLYHLILCLERGDRDLRDGELFMVGLLGRNKRRIGGQWKVNTREWYQVGLKLCEVNIQSAIESERRGYWADHLRYDPVNIWVGGKLDAQVALANVKYGLVVDHERTVRMLQGRVGGQYWVVRLHDRTWQFRLLKNFQFSASDSIKLSNFFYYRWIDSKF